MKIKLTTKGFAKVTVAAFALAVLSTSIAAVEVDAAQEISETVAVRKVKEHDPSLAISVEAVRYKIRQNHTFTLVDVRSTQDFDRLHIPGSVNIPLHAVKTKSYLKSAPLVLVNEGFGYQKLTGACEQLAKRGFEVSILDGGLPAWKQNGGELIGDLFALEEMKVVSPRTFYLEKEYAGLLPIDVSSSPTVQSRQYIQAAHHFPGLAASFGAVNKLKHKLAAGKNTPLQTVVIFNQNGDDYERIENRMAQSGLAVFYLKGGVDAYKKYLEQLALSWKPRDDRIKTSGGCQPCESEREEDVVQ